LEQVSVLTERQWVTFWRGDTLSWQTLAQFCGLAGLAGMLWWQLHTEESGIFLRTALCLWIVGTWTFFPMFGAMPCFVENSVILRKELSVGAYNLLAFYVARTVTVIPLDWGWPFFYTTAVYWMTLPNPSFIAYIATLGSTLLTVVTMQSVGQLISAGVPKEQMVTVSVLVITYFFGYSGLFAPDVESWLSWAEELNLLVYAYHLLLRGIITEEMSFTCDPLRSDYTVCPPGPIRSWDVLEKHNVDNTAGFCVAVLVGSSVGMRLLAYRILRHTYTHYFHIWTYNPRFYSLQVLRDFEPALYATPYYHIWTYNPRFHSLNRHTYTQQEAVDYNAGGGREDGVAVKADGPGAATSGEEVVLQDLKD